MDESIHTIIDKHKVMTIKEAKHHQMMLIFTKNVEKLLLQIKVVGNGSKELSLGYFCSASSRLYLLALQIYSKISTFYVDEANKTWLRQEIREAVRKHKEKEK